MVVWWVWSGCGRGVVCVCVCWLVWCEEGGCDWCYACIDCARTHIQYLSITSAL